MDSRKSCFEKAISGVTKELKDLLLQIDTGIKCNCYEIRLRVNKPVSLVCNDGLYYLSLSGEPIKNTDNTYLVTRELLTDTFSRLCGYSVYTYQSDIINGFITIEGGHRVGICGTAVRSSEDNIQSVRDITSINIRIAKEIKGCADSIIRKLFTESDHSILIAGPPSSGKTTLIRDLVRQLSDSGKKFCLIDERQELACVHKGIPQMDVGCNTDIYSDYPKTKAINIALRTMSPDIIAIDEVCDEHELRAIKYAANSGVKLIVSVHAESLIDIAKRIQSKLLIDTEAFDKLVLLGKDRSVSIYDIGEIKDEIFRLRADLDWFSVDGDEMLDAI